MKLVGRVPVEPLDDERMTNIERSIVAGAADAAAAARPERSSRRYLGFAAAAMAALVTGVIGWKLGHDPSTAPVVGESTPLRVDTREERPILYIGDATIHSDPHTQFAVTRPDGGVLVNMLSGKVELRVSKRINRPPLVVRAGDTDVIVVGTRFSVDYGDGTGEVDVRVTEGVVKVVRRRPGQAAPEVRVTANQAWTTRRGMITLAEAVAADRAHGIVAGTTGTSDGSGSEAGTGTVALDDDGTLKGSGDYEINTDATPDVLRDRVAQTPDVRTPGTGSGSASTTPRVGNGSGSAGSTTKTSEVPIDPKDPRRDLKKLIKSQPVAPAVEVGAPTPAEAIAKYYTMIREAKTGEEESAAFYSIAATQAMQLGRTGDALKTLDGYFRRFGRGKRYAEYASALWLRVRIKCLKAIDDDCRQAAYTYAHQASEGPATNLANRISLED